MENQEQQELMYNLGLFEQQIYYLRQQLQAIEHGIVEMSSLNIGLDELKKGINKDILAPIGKGIFVNAKMTSEELIVDVGGKNLVKKSIPDTQIIISEQIKRLEDIKGNLEENLEKIGEEITKTMIEAQEKERNQPDR